MTKEEKTFLISWGGEILIVFFFLSFVTLRSCYPGASSRILPQCQYEGMRWSAGAEWCSEPHISDWSALIGCFFLHPVITPTSAALKVRYKVRSELHIFFYDLTVLSQVGVVEVCVGGGGGVGGRGFAHH